MRNKCLITVSLALLGAATAFPQAALNTFPSRIVGHPNPEQLQPLASSNPNLVEGRELYYPAGIALDTSTSPAILYVSDSGNNRVLAWRNSTSFADGQKADLVIGQQPDPVTGQPNFYYTNALGPASGTGFNSGLTSPTGLAVDSKGNLYVADSGNNRVLRFPKPFAQSSNPSPDMVIGQTGNGNNGVNASLGSSTIGAKGFSFSGTPAGLAINPQTGDLFVTDPGNRRVLGFRASDLAAGSNGPSAYIALGQQSLTSVYSTTLDPYVLTSLQVAYQFAVPRGIVFDSTGRLYVADADSNATTLCATLTGRVLVFDSSAISTGASASHIYGVFPTNTASITADQSNRACMAGPTGLFVLQDGSLGVVETGSNRILIFPGIANWPSSGAPLALEPAAGGLGLIGQPDFTTRAANAWQGTQGTPPASATTLWAPLAAVYSGTELFIADTWNNRVLVMPQQSGDSFGAATRWLGQDRSNTNSVNLIEGREFNFQSDAGLAVDSTGSTPHLYVADPLNHRILGFKDVRTIKAGAKADLVIGQPDMATALCNYNPQNPAASGNMNSPNAYSLCGPIGLLVDSAGNLYVADSLNGRVLRFPAPFAWTGAGMESADLVLGKQSFTDTISDPSNRTLNTPYGLAFSGVNGLMVSDNAYNRVLYFPFTGNGTFSAGRDNGLAAAVVFGQPNFTAIATGSDATTLSSPRHLASDSSGRVYVADTGNSRIQIFGDPHSTYTSASGSSAVFSITGLAAPRGIFVNPSTGEIWVANTTNGTCLKYADLDTLRSATSVQSSGGVYAAGYTLALVQDQYKNLYVADTSSRVAAYYPGLVVVNGANFLAGRALAPGAIASICAGDSSTCTDSSSTQFGTGSTVNGVIPWPTTLGNIQVLVDGVAAPLYYVGPYQINFLMPMAPNKTSGTSDVLVIQQPSGQILGDGTVSMASASPGIFMRDFSGTQRRAIVQNIDKDGSVTLNDTSAPASRGSIIVIWATGQGYIPNAPPDGSVPSGALSTPALPRVIIGSQFTDSVTLLPGDPTDGQFVKYSGLSGFPGLWQINVQIPMSVVPGTTVPIAVTMDDIGSSMEGQFVLTIAVQ
jgi:uncharacterized protein (TIGR03437 family)